VASGGLSASITLLHGDNSLEIEDRIQIARDAIDPTGLSTSTFSEASRSTDEIALAVGSPGFFGAERLVICHDLISPRSGGRRKKSSSDDQADPLSFLKSVAPGVWVIITESELKSADEKRLRGFAPGIDVRAIAVPRGRGLIDWACERARRHDAMLDGATATRLVEALFPGTWREASRRDDVPPDLYRLDAELAKLAVAAGPGMDITADHVSELVVNADANDIWGLSNAIADRDPARAVKQLELALDTGQAPEAILGQLVGQFESFAVVQAARGRPNQAVAKMTGLSEGRIRQAARSARHYAREDLRRAMVRIREVDFGIKQGLHEPADAMASLVADLAKRSTR
jgi:DNA polymerase III delta subunit